MTSHDLPSFSVCFDRLSRLSLNFSPRQDDREHVKSEYFEALRAYPITAIEAATDRLRDTCTTWPKIPDWIAALPATGSVSQLPLATEAEMREVEQAEGWVYNQPEVCHCTDCMAADCHMPPRYVPRENRDGTVVTVQHPSRPSRPIVLGIFLHGEPLKRWYAARAAFFALHDRLGMKTIRNLQLVKSE